MSVFVPGYTRKDGSVVAPYRRKKKAKKGPTRRNFSKKQLQLLNARRKRTKTQAKKMKTRRPA